MRVGLGLPVSGTWATPDSMRHVATRADELPAVVAFNHFTGKIETFHVEMNRASTQLVNCLFKIPETKIPELKVSGVRVSDVNVQEVVHAAR